MPVPRSASPMKSSSHQGEMLTWFEQSHPELGRELETTGELPDELKERITAAAKEFYASWAKRQNAAK